MALPLVIFVFIIWRISDFLIISFSQKIVPYLGFFPYANQLPLFHLPTWVSSLANFDGLHYILIAKNGYSQYEQAFFPLYPLTIKFFSLLFSNNQLLAGLIISNISFLIGLIVFYKYLRLISSDLTDSTDSTDYIRFYPILSILFLLVFPTSFFFGAVYTEGLFFFLVVSSLYFLKKENYLLVSLFAFLTATTRIVGVFLIIPIVFHWLDQYQKSKIKNQNDKLNSKNNKKPFIIIFNYFQLFIALFSPILGLASYCFYLWKTTGDPFFFFSSQPAFGASRSTHLITFLQVYWRYFKIFFTATHNFQYFVSIIEFSFFSFVLIILVLDLFKNLGITRPSKPKGRSGENLKLNKNFKFQISNFDLLGLNFFSLINIILPTLTGTFLSIPRFSLMSLSVFVYLAQIKNNFIKYLILFFFIVLHVVLLGLFTQGYFVS